MLDEFGWRATVKMLSGTCSRVLEEFVLILFRR
jgi:hypothetical protein